MECHACSSCAILLSKCNCTRRYANAPTGCCRCTARKAHMCCCCPCMTNDQKICMRAVRHTKSAPPDRGAGQQPGPHPQSNTLMRASMGMYEQHTSPPVWLNFTSPRRCDLVVLFRGCFLQLLNCMRVAPSLLFMAACHDAWSYKVTHACAGDLASIGCCDRSSGQRMLACDGGQSVLAWWSTRACMEGVPETDTAAGCWTSCWKRTAH